MDTVSRGRISIDGKIIPSVQDFKTGVLDKYSTQAVETRNKILSILLGWTVCVDSWVDTFGNRVQGSVIQVGSTLDTRCSRPYVWEAVNMTFQHEYKDIAQSIRNILDNPVLQYRSTSRVQAVVTSSESEYIKARGLLSREYKNILFLPCYASQLNEIVYTMLRFIPEVCQVLQTCYNIIDLYSYSHDRQKHLHKFQRTGVHGESTFLGKKSSRWANVFQAISSIRYSLGALTESLREYNEVKLLQRIQDPTFEKKLDIMCSIIGETYLFQENLESDDAKLAAVLPVVFRISKVVEKYPLLYWMKERLNVWLSRWDVEVLITATILYRQKYTELFALNESQVIETLENVHYRLFSRRSETVSQAYYAWLSVRSYEESFWEKQRSVTDLLSIKMNLDKVVPKSSTVGKHFTGQQGSRIRRTPSEASKLAIIANINNMELEDDNNNIKLEDPDSDPEESVERDDSEFEHLKNPLEEIIKEIINKAAAGTGIECVEGTVFKYTVDTLFNKDFRTDDIGFPTKN